MRLETLKEIRRHIHAIDIALEREIEQQSPERSREAPLAHEISSNQAPLVGSLVTQEESRK